MKKECSIWISIVSLLLSVIAVCVAVWRSPELDFDYQGVLVGVLSLLVTVLIGWQICYFVFVKQEINKEVNKRLAELSNVQFEALNMIHLADCSSHIAGCLKYNEWYKAMLLYSDKIDYVCSLRDKEKADRTVRELINLLNNMGKFNSDEIEEFKRLIEKSKELSKVTDSCFDFYSNAMKKIQENCNAS